MKITDETFLAFAKSSHFNNIFPKETPNFKFLTILDTMPSDELSLPNALLFMRVTVS